MIKLRRQTCPEILDVNCEAWTIQAQEELAKNGKFSRTSLGRYRRAPIKRALAEDSHGKCMYCEAKILANGYGHIEHIQPKSKFPDQMFVWKNLGFVCEICNGNKLDYYDDSLPFIDPYEENPSDFLGASGAYIKSLPNNTRGEITEQIIDLNRAPLLEKRLERMQKIRHMIKLYQVLKDAEKAAFSQELKEEMRDDKEFAMIIKALIQSNLQE